jgi:hypothetical protein
MRKIFHLVGRVDRGNTQVFRVAFTTESSAAKFLSTQQVLNGKWWPCEVEEHMLTMAPFLAIQSPMGNRPELVLTSAPVEQVVVDPFVDATQAGLALWHVDYEEGQLKPRIAFGSSAVCHPEHFPSMEERVKVERDGTLFHVLASTVEAAISMAAEKRAALVRTPNASA